MLNYIKEEGMWIEPDFYVPIIPMVLANGADGIGTGWSTNVPQYSPLDIVANLRRKLQSRSTPFKRMTPWYRGYNGQITYQDANNSYQFTGRYDYSLPSKLVISELPIKKWTRDFKNFLEEMAKNDEIEDIKEFHKDNTVKFVLTVNNLKEIINSEGGIVKKFKLTSSLSMNNIVLFDNKSRVKKYANECEILEEFYPIRYDLYSKRKSYQLSVMKKELSHLTNKCKFVSRVNNGTIVLRDRNKL